MNVLSWLSNITFFCVALVALMIMFENIMFAWLAQGIKVQTRYNRGDYSGIEKLFAAVFAAGFLVMDYIMRQTLLVIVLRIMPSNELVSHRIEYITANPRLYEPWQVMIAHRYRVDIESVDDVHFSQQNNAPKYLLGYLQQQIERLA